VVSNVLSFRTRKPLDPADVRDEQAPRVTPAEYRLMDQIRVAGARVGIVIKFEADRDEHGNTYVHMDYEGINTGMVLCSAFIHDAENSRWVLWNHIQRQTILTAPTLLALLQKWQKYRELTADDVVRKLEVIQEAASM
jgi:hypothetical protein